MSEIFRFFSRSSLDGTRPRVRSFKKKEKRSVYPKHATCICSIYLQKSVPIQPKTSNILPKLGHAAGIPAARPADGGAAGAARPIYRSGKSVNLFTGAGRELGPRGARSGARSGECRFRRPLQDEALVVKIADDKRPRTSSLKQPA